MLNFNKYKTQSNITNSGAKATLLPYVGFFAVGFLLANAVFMIIQMQFQLNPYLITIISIFVGAYIAVSKFIKHKKRALSSSEMNRLTIGGIGSVWLLTGIYFMALWLWLFDAANRAVFIEMSRQQPWPLIAALVLILVITLVSARLSLLIINRLLDPNRKIA